MNILLEHYETYRSMYKLDTPEGRERTEGLTKLINKYLHLPKKSLVLDVGCANGVSSLALKNCGYRVIGIDIRTEPCCDAKKYFSKNKIKAHFLSGDMCLAPFAGNRFDGVVLLFNPIPHWSIYDLSKIASETRRILKSGGICMLDFLDMVELVFTGMWRETLAEPIDDKYIVSIQRRFNMSQGTVERAFIDTTAGKSYLNKFHLWAEWLIDYVFQSAGFSKISFTRQDTTYPRKVMIAKK